MRSEDNNFGNFFSFIVSPIDSNCGCGIVLSKTNGSSLVFSTSVH